MSTAVFRQSALDALIVARLEKYHEQCAPVFALQKQLTKAGFSRVEQVQAFERLIRNQRLEYTQYTSLSDSPQVALALVKYGEVKQ